MVSKAADQGFARAQFNLGGMYAYGEGVLKDDKQAVKWYQKLLTKVMLQPNTT